MPRLYIYQNSLNKTDHDENLLEGILGHFDLTILWLSRDFINTFISEKEYTFVFKQRALQLFDNHCVNNFF
jgi:hypothetical protein